MHPLPGDDLVKDKHDKEISQGLSTLILGQLINRIKDYFDLPAVENHLDCLPDVVLIRLLGQLADEADFLLSS